MASDKKERWRILQLIKRQRRDAALNTKREFIVPYSSIQNKNKNIKNCCMVSYNLFFMRR